MNQFFKTKTEVESWLIEYGVRDYVILPDMSVNVMDHVDLSRKEIKVLPVQFGEIHGRFDISYNALKTLKGCPQSVHGMFDCDNNKLTSLEDCPLYVGGIFSCMVNKLISLKGVGSSVVKSNFFCAHNKIERIDYCLKELGKYFYCNNNPFFRTTQDSYNFEQLREVCLETMVEKEKEKLNQEVNLGALISGQIANCKKKNKI